MTVFRSPYVIISLTFHASILIQAGAVLFLVLLVDALEHYRFLFDHAMRQVVVRSLHVYFSLQYLSLALRIHLLDQLNDIGLQWLYCVDHAHRGRH